MKLWICGYSKTTNFCLFDDYHRPVKHFNQEKTTILWKWVVESETNFKTQRKPSIFKQIIFREPMKAI